MRTRYTVTIKLNDDQEHVIPCSTYQEMANKINSSLGYKLVSKAIITNWMSRGRKASKWDFITIT